MTLDELLRGRLLILINERRSNLSALARKMGVPVQQLHGFLHPRPGKQPRGISGKKIHLSAIAEFFNVTIPFLLTGITDRALDTAGNRQNSTGAAAPVTSAVTPSRQNPTVPALTDEPAGSEVPMPASLVTLLVPQLVAALALLSQEDQLVIFEGAVKPKLAERLVSYMPPQQKPPNNNKKNS